jgi:hypothetical protein
MTRIKYDGPQTLPNQMDEHFVLVDDEAEAKFVNRRLNDREAAARKKRRMEHLRERGEVNEVLMPDTFNGLMWHARLVQSELIREARARGERAKEEQASRFITLLPKDSES